jgi:hypothetical protein
VNNSITIKNALETNTSSQLEAMIVDQNEEIHFTENDQQRKYKTYIISDCSTSSPIIIYDQLVDNLNINETYIFTNIKNKKLHDNIVLVTSSNTTITKTNTVNITFLKTLL